MTLTGDRSWGRTVLKIKTMKNILLFWIFILGITFNYANNHPYNGIYEGVVQIGSNTGPYGLGKNKSLIRLHIYVHEYPNPKYRDMYDRSTRETSRPQSVMGLLEVYDNKKGRGTPKRSYFTATAYTSSSGLSINYMEKYASEQQGKINLNSGKISKFTIPKHGAQEFEMKVGYSYYGKYKKVSSYQHFPSSLFPYLEAVLKSDYSRNKGKINLGNSGSKSISRIHTEGPDVSAATIDATFTYSNTGNFSYENPAMSWIEGLEYQLQNCLKNQTYGAHENLKYLPNVNKISVYITSSGNSNSERLHFFDVKIDRNSSGLDFEIIRTPISDNYVSRATMEDNKRRIEAERKRKERDIAAANLRKREEEALIAEQMRLQNESIGLLETERFSINTTGLKHGDLIRNFFEGNFDDIEFTRDDLVFSGMYYKYLEAYSRNCGDYLPTNKIELIEQKCVREQVTENGFGVELSRVCIEYVDVPTGIYASPSVYDTYKDLSGIKNYTAISTAFGALLNPNKLGNMTNDAMRTRELGSDLVQLLKQNGCNSKAVKRFEDNLIAFAHNELPITFGKHSGVKLSSGGVDYSRKQDFVELLDDLLYADSKSWLFQYAPGYVVIKDIQRMEGRNIPTRIEASYRFESTSGYNWDVVELTFKNGIPDCLRFPKFGNQCKTANRQVIAKLKQGNYILED